MTPQETAQAAAEAAARDARISELATGFAINELTDDELRELHGQLVDPTHGQAAARSAWRTLETVTDLRAERSSSLQDTVRSRIEESAGSAGGSGITARFLRRIGLRRGALAPVLATGGTPRRRSTWWLGCIIILLGAAATVTWWLTAVRPVARVVAVVGRATVATTTLGPGDPLDGRPLSAAAGAVLTLRWADGSQAVLSGPGTLVPSRDGLALLGGTVQVDAIGPLALGLPDGFARAAAGTRFTAAVTDGRSCLGTAQGVLETDDGPLSAGFARAAGVTFTWEHLTWTRLPGVLPTTGIASWRLALHAAPIGDGRITLTWPTGGLTVDAQSVTLQRDGTPLVRAVHPPGTAQIELAAGPAGFTIRLQDEELLRLATAPTSVATTTTGQVPLAAVFTSGPLLVIGTADDK